MAGETNCFVVINIAMFDEMSAIEREELIVSLATLILADAKVEVTVIAFSDFLWVEGEPRCHRGEVRQQDCCLLDRRVRCQLW